MREARETRRRLYLLFVREQAFVTDQDRKRKWQDDPEASTVFAEAKQKAAGVVPLFAYAVSPSAAETIVDVAATLGAARLILGAPKRNALINLLRGNVIRELTPQNRLRALAAGSESVAKAHELETKRRYNADALDHLSRMYGQTIPARNLHLIMGTMLAHPRTFIIIGLLRSGFDPAELAKQGSPF